MTAPSADVLLAALNLISTLSDPKQSKKVLDEIEDRIAVARESEQRAVKAQADAQARIQEMQAAELKHNTAASEAARRLETGRGQAAELLRLQAEINAKQEALDRQEKDLAQREKRLALDKVASEALTQHLREQAEKFAVRRRKAEEFLKEAL